MFNRLIESLEKKKTYVMVLSCIVVFITTYVLILPAVTLDKEEAAQQGGIDLPQQSEQVLDEDIQAQDDQMQSGSISFSGKGYEVSMECDGAGLPEGTQLVAEEIGKSDKSYEGLYEDALNAVRKDSENKVSDLAFAKFYDISLMAGDECIEPENPVEVNISLDEALKASDAKNVRIVHFAVNKKTGEVKPEVLAQKKVDASVKSGKLTDTTFEAKSFSVYALVYTVDFTLEEDGEQSVVKGTDEQFKETAISADGKAYEISVTYGEDAQIPDGATLDITEFTEDSEKYQAAREAVVDKKQSELPGFDDNEIGLTAFDLSIVDKDGEQVEPKAAVDVSMKMKSLPDDAVEENAQNSIEIHHLNESSGEVAVETVASASDGSIQIEKETAQAEFQLESFSTFTVSWNSRSTNDSTTTLRWLRNNVARAYLTVQYTDENGNPITRPNGLPSTTGGNTVDYSELYSGSGHTFSIPDDLGKAINNYTYRGAYVTDREGTKHPVTSVRGERQDNTTTVTYYNGTEVVLSASYTGTDRHNFDDDYLKLTIEYESNNHTTVHYGYMENGVFHEFSEQPDPTDTSTSDGWAYLIYDFHGKDEGGLPFEYNYSSTYYLNQETGNPTTGTSVAPVLRYNNNAWRYYSTSHSYTDDDLNNNNNWTSVTNNSHLYVVYDKPNIQNGGTPTLDADMTEPDVPDILKQSKENGDGTNTLSLNITGSSKEIEVEKLADVIVVLDLSSSMQNNIHNTSSTGNNYANNTNSRFYQAKQAVTTLADNLYKKNENGKSLIRMGLVTFSGNAQVRQELTDSKDTFLSTVNSITRYEGKGTNWEHALKLANEMSVDSGRATFVVFVTDGEPTSSQTRFGLSNTRLRSNIFLSGNTGGGVRRGYSHSVHNDYYNMLHFYLRSGTFGTTSAHDPGQYTENGVTLSGDMMNTTAAHDDAKSIVDHNKNFYVITISDDVGTDTLDELIQKAGVPASHGIPATNEEDLIAAFDSIQSEITGLLGWSDIQMTDGITDLSNTVMDKTSLFGVDDDYTYWKAASPAGWKNWSESEKSAYMKGIESTSDDDPPGWNSWTDLQKTAYNAGKNAVFEPWGPASENCQPATYEDKTVIWNMGPRFMLQDGCTYRVSFTVWPSQEAYDWIADLKNGTRTWADVVAAGLDYPNGRNPQIIDNGNGTYSLATNRPGANTTYKTAIKSGENVTPSGEARTLLFNNVEPMGLKEEKIAVRKRFAHAINSVSPLQKIIFTLMRGEETYKTKDGEDYQIELPTRSGASPDQYEYWQDDAYVAVGLIKTLSGEGAGSSSSPGYLVLEPGHDYWLKESIPDGGGDAFEYQFTSQVVRPMVVGTELKCLVKKDELYNTNPDNKTEYTIEGSVYYEHDAGVQALTGTNRKTSELDITKMITDDTGSMTDAQLDAETFTYRVTLTVPSDGDISGITAYEYVPRATPLPPGSTAAPRFYAFGYITGEEEYPVQEGTSAVTPDDEKTLGIASDVERFDGQIFGQYRVRTDEGATDYTMKHMFTTNADGTKTATIDITLKRNEIIRFTNLPTGTTYTITEMYANYRQANPSLNADAGGSSKPSNISEQGYSTTIATKNYDPKTQDVKTRTKIEGTTINGEIQYPDVRYYNQFTNTLGEHIDIELKARKHLEGYKWSGERYYINLTAGEGSPEPLTRNRFYRSFPAGAEGNADTEGYTFGKIRFTEAGTYTYTIDEDNAGKTVDGITYDTAKELTFVIEKDINNKLYVASVTGDDTEWNAETNTSMTTITNRTLSVNIKKIDSVTKSKIEGAEFELLQGSEKLYLDENNKILTAAKVKELIQMSDLTTNEAIAAMETAKIRDSFTIGEITLSALNLGTTYTLKEIHAPDGYVVSSNDASFSLSKNDQGKVVISATGDNVSVDEDGVTILIENTPGVELPESGGPGTTWIYLLGSLLLIGCGVLLVARRRMVH